MKMSMRQQIDAAISMLDDLIDDYPDADEVSFDFKERSQYRMSAIRRHACALMLLPIGLYYIERVVFKLLRLYELYGRGIRIIIACLLAYFFVCRVRDREKREDRITGSVTLLRYSRKNLTRINQQIARTEAELEEIVAAQREEAMAHIKVAYNAHIEAAIETAKKVLPKFEVLFDIIRNELGGEVNPILAKDCSQGEDTPATDQIVAVNLKLPVIECTECRLSGPYKEDHEIWHFALTEKNLQRLTCHIAILRLAMREINTLQDLMDATVQSEE